ncbi:stage V sporulation protein AC [Melghirimyces algeriensis]|uniref:Stage V sporulation protein AC n=1 Tax=Melghirimyces algeriensis TaxID=910412 RepID=A0A521CSA6_9BACL|nr:stage V sporulation protein AC [Melghirimyces algeriensis]SMO61621.1 stage V sporulation protein AC [Melghirimyces algeriensis]
MAQNKDQKQKQQKKQQMYQNMARKYQPTPNVWINCLKAFIVGGLVCVLGQLLQTLYIKGFGVSPNNAGDMTVATLIFLSCLLTGLGVYDKMGQWAGAGTAVPVTGFANSIASAALEHQSEGYVLGVGGNMFKLAGSVIVFGVVAAFFIGVIRTLLTYIIG